MNTTVADFLRTITREAEANIPVKVRAEMACAQLWERMLPLSAPGEFRLILRLARHGMKLALIAESDYYMAMFTTMRDTIERRLSA